MGREEFPASYGYKLLATHRKTCSSETCLTIAPVSSLANNASTGTPLGLSELRWDYRTPWVTGSTVGIHVVDPRAAHQSRVGWVSRASSLHIPGVGHPWVVHGSSMGNRN